jgi:hypothetical protein
MILSFRAKFIIVVNVGEIFIFIFNLSRITGKKSFVLCRFVPLRSVFCTVSASGVSMGLEPLPSFRQHNAC